jgi:hypothetical protein
MFRTIIVLVVVGFVAVVFWRGWLNVSLTNNAEQNETDATLTINKNNKLGFHCKKLMARRDNTRLAH